MLDGQYKINIKPCEIMHVYFLKSDTQITSVEKIDQLHSLKKASNFSFAKKKSHSFYMVHFHIIDYPNTYPK